MTTKSPPPHERAELGSPTPAWHACSTTEVISELAADPQHGLSQNEASRRLSSHGLNEIRAARGRTVSGMLLGQLANVLILILFAAAAVSALLGDWRDVSVILIIVVLNAIVGVVQEYRAEKAVAALRRLAAPRTQAKRDGGWTQVPAAELVPGDLVRLEAGDLVTADVRLLEASGLRIDESSLTGESIPVTKEPDRPIEPGAQAGDRLNMAFRGTLVTGGHAQGICVATGQRTEIGHIADLLERAGDVQSPLQRRLARFGKQLAIVILLVCALIFAGGVARGEDAMLMLLTAVTLAVAAIPEALPAVVTVALALGARKMVQRNALIRRLPAVETLGSVTFICTDKTGTLTQNRMQVGTIFCGGEREPGLRAGPPSGSLWDCLARAMALSNDVRHDAAGELSGDPTEVALLEAAAAAGYAKSALEADSPRIAEVAFDEKRRRMTTVHRVGTEVQIFVKGAPESVLPLCTHFQPADPDSPAATMEPEPLLAQAERFASEGYRVLAFAMRRLPQAPERDEADEVERDLSFLGLIALHDPPREGVAEAIEICKTSGITPVMITGDHPSTAAAIGSQLGIAPPGTPPLTGRELAARSSEELAHRCRTAPIYARVSPEQKIDIVAALQESGEFVAMTGDGVNDAPALKRAEIGIAMGLAGTEVARESSDMVLMDDNFTSIVGAVREGRRVFDNIRKFIKYTMTSNAGEIWTLSLAPLFGLPLPLLPIQILWINLVTDGLPGLALAREPEEPGLMKRPPRPPSESIFAHGLWQHVVWVGLLIAALSIGAQAWAYHAGSENWQSVVFTVLTLSQLAHALAIRSDRDSLIRTGVVSNLILLGAVLLTVGLQMAVLYVPALNTIFHTSPLTPRELAICFAAPFAIVLAVEIEKWLMRRGRLY